MTRMTPAQAKKLVKGSNTKIAAMLSQLGSAGEEAMARNLQVYKLRYEREYQFNPDTKHRADFFLPDYNLLVEIEGGTKGKSRHTSHDGYSKDLEKYNGAAILGYSRLAFTTEQVNNGKAIETINTFIMTHHIRNRVQLARLKLSEVKLDVPAAILEAEHRPAQG